ncbi:DUF1365 domain-containing protein [Trebonia kvetii]|uniref:DUF1365 domain-containing protein n=1 Tax=Trebonia kvetii TaxID=2480626 RepID=A0A6P2C8A0_9ACTN|nr:DUF1365 domain-containing protein [Trebonia kvetii]
MLYECRIVHARPTPLRNVFSYRTYEWLVDIDKLPRPGGWRSLLAGFGAPDHLGDPGRSIRENVDEFLRTRGVDLDGGQVLMLAHARVLGYVFNPLSVYWCHRADGTLDCVIAEVHNTYGQLHAYLLHTDGQGRARAGKELYVSPYHPVDGWYQMSLPRPAQRLALSITLHRPNGYLFAASVRGAAVPATRLALLRATVRHPCSTVMVSARIRWQGIKLYARGLRPVPRPARHPQEGVQ